VQTFTGHESDINAVWYGVFQITSDLFFWDLFVAFGFCECLEQFLFVCLFFVKQVYNVFCLWLCLVISQMVTHLGRAQTIWHAVCLIFVQTARWWFTNTMKWCVVSHPWHFQFPDDTCLAVTMITNAMCGTRWRESAFMCWKGMRIECHVWEWVVMVWHFVRDRGTLFWRFVFGVSLSLSLSLSLSFDTHKHILFVNLSLTLSFQVWA
jgi:hypothetical protein